MAEPKTRAEFKDYCLNNKYSTWYFNIIENAIARNFVKKNSQIYVEGHHIIPKSIFKNNDIVYLTAREHFICHLLLPKMLESKDKRKMMFALHRLVFGNKHISVKYVKNSTQYKRIKEKCSLFFSERTKIYWKNVSTEAKLSRALKISKSNTGKKFSEETKRKISEKAKIRLQDKSKHPLYNKGHSEQTKIQMSKNAPAKNYIFYNGNNKIEVFNLRKFCRDNNLDQGAMTRINNGKQKVHKGYSKCLT